MHDYYILLTGYLKNIGVQKMFNTRLAPLCLLIGSFCISGCANAPSQEKQGMVIGGVIGAVLGSQVGDGRGRIIATAAGTLVGSMIGGSIGQRLDELDRLKTGHTLETVRTGVSSEWVNPDTGYRYSVTPTNTYESSQGTPCREFTMTASIGGKEEQVYGTACRQQDGSWRIQS